MSERFTESIIEQAALSWLESVGYLVLSGPEIAPGEAMAEREAAQELVEDDHDRRVRRRGRGRLSNMSSITEPEPESPDPHDYEERADLEREPLPPPTTMGAQVDRHRRWGFKR